MIIKVDSREQNPLEFSTKNGLITVVTTGLPFGDYWCAMQDKDGNEMNEVPIMFERKSISDLYSTLTNEDNIRRHKEKIKKAEQMGCRMFMIVEGTLSDVEEGYEYSEAKPLSVVKTIFTFMVKYNFMPIFCKDRAEMVRFMIHTWHAFGRNFKPVKPELSITTALDLKTSYNGTLIEQIDTPKD